MEVLYQVPISISNPAQTFRNGNVTASISVNYELVFSSKGAEKILEVKTEPSIIITRNHEYEIRPTTQGLELSQFQFFMQFLQWNVKNKRKSERMQVNPQGFRELGNPPLW
jgi:hypothetical protein